jgi:hypothetical protein
LIFIHFCETFLGVLPHFNLFRHLFWLKKKGGGGSKVVGGIYLQLQDGMASEYINVPLNTSLKGWNSKWFYMKQRATLQSAAKSTISRRTIGASRRNQIVLTWNK